MTAARRTISLIGASALLLVATVGPALARETGGDGGMWLLARAAGLNHDQIATAFKNDSNLKTDFSNVQSSKQAMTTCIVSGAACGNQISTYANAVQTLAQEKMAVWQNLFKTAPNPKQASTVLNQLEQLRTQRHQIIQQALGSSTGTGADTSGGSGSQSE